MRNSNQGEGLQLHYQNPGPKAFARTMSCQDILTAWFPNGARATFISQEQCDAAIGAQRQDVTWLSVPAVMDAVLYRARRCNC